MSLWLCKTHGLTAPRACCADAEYGTVEPPRCLTCQQLTARLGDEGWYRCVNAACPTTTESRTESRTESTTETESSVTNKNVPVAPVPATPAPTTMSRKEQERYGLLSPTSAPPVPEDREEATPWPARDVVAELVARAEHLLSHHNCDCHGYELTDQALTVAKAWLAAHGSTEEPNG